MPYNAQDKLEMTLRQARVDIGQGRGNVLSNAITWAIANKLTLDQALEIAEKLFHYQQVSIEKDYQSWLSANEIKIKMDLGLIEPVIQEEQAL